MIIWIECTAKTKDELEDLLRIGGYRDYSEAVALAISNQLLLQRGAKAGSGAATITMAEKPPGRDPELTKAVPQRAPSTIRNRPTSRGSRSYLRALDPTFEQEARLPSPTMSSQEDRRSPSIAGFSGSTTSSLPCKRAFERS